MEVRRLSGDRPGFTFSHELVFPQAAVAKYIVLGGPHLPLRR